MNHMQIARSFDAVTLGKMKTSALVATAGWVITVVPVVTLGIEAAIREGRPFDWRTPLAMTVSVIGTWCANTAKEWLKGVKSE